MKTALLLTISNVFMTCAWYGHLKFENRPLWMVIIVSWLIAFFEYCFQVPANRIGYLSGITPGQLKIMQEVITLVVFVVFARVYLSEKFTWNYYAAFGLILGAVALVFVVKPAAS
ncbi:MAG: DMT family protein [Tepidisphaeraceae bacterium]